MSDETKALTVRTAAGVIAPSAERDFMSERDLGAVLGNLIGRRLVGYQFEADCLVLHFEGDVWLRYSDVHLERPARGGES